MKKLLILLLCLFTPISVYANTWNDRAKPDYARISYPIPIANRDAKQGEFIAKGGQNANIMFRARRMQEIFAKEGIEKKYHDELMALAYHENKELDPCMIGFTGDYGVVQFNPLYWPRSTYACIWTSGKIKHTRSRTEALERQTRAFAQGIKKQLDNGMCIQSMIVRHNCPMCARKDVCKAVAYPKRGYKNGKNVFIGYVPTSQFENIAYYNAFRNNHAELLIFNKK